MPNGIGEVDLHGDNVGLERRHLSAKSGDLLALSGDGVQERLAIAPLLKGEVLAPHAPDPQRQDEGQQQPHQCDRGSGDRDNGYQVRVKIERSHKSPWRRGGWGPRLASPVSGLVAGATVRGVDLVPFFITLALIIPAELPDKTFIATLVLSTRYRPVVVWLGVSAAFAVQTTIAVAAGQLLSLLPETPVQLITAGLFALGSVLMFTGAGGIDPEADEAAETEAVDAMAGRGHRRAFTVSFLVLFAAEWGDLSQLTTASLSARYDAPVEVWLGAWLALSLVAGLAALAGRALVARVRFAVVQRVSGTLLALLALVTLADAVGLISQSV